MRTYFICLSQIYDIYEVYTCSFSKNADVLSQWRGYCPEQGGFCIGFDSDLFVQEDSYQLLECLYEIEDQKNSIELLALKFCENIEKIICGERLQFSEWWNLVFSKMEIKPYYPNKKVKNHLDLEKLHILIRYELAQLCARLKHPSFKEEEEYRYIYIADRKLDDEIKVRSRDNLLIPYKEIGFKGDSIKEIVIGPSSNMSLNVKSLELYNKKSEMNFNIIESEIPYKNW